MSRILLGFLLTHGELGNEVGAGMRLLIAPGELKEEALSHPTFKKNSSLEDSIKVSATSYFCAIAIH